MPAIDDLDNEVGRVRELEGQALTAIEQTTGCDGCALKEDAEATGVINCKEMGRCIGIIWVRRVSMARGPYQGAYTEMLRRRRLDKLAAPAAVWRNDALGRHMMLTEILAKRPGWKDRTLHSAVEYCLDKHGAPVDWHELALQQPAKSKDQTRLSYYRTDAHRVKETEDNDGHLTVTTIGKYLKRHWPALKDDEIRNIAERFGPGVLKISYDPADFIRIAETGPYSCMKWGNKRVTEDGVTQYSSSGGSRWGPHPYEVYDPALGWGIAYAMKDGKVVGRAVTYEKGDVKCFVRTYNDTVNGDGFTESHFGLQKYLEDLGFEYLEAWPDGVQFKYLEDCHGDPVMPYLDPGSQRANDCDRRVCLEDGVWVKRTRGGRNPKIAACTDGTLCDPEDSGDDGDDDTVTCEDCNDRVDGDYTTSVGWDNDRCVCDRCAARNYTMVTGRRRQDYYVPDNEVVEVLGTDTKYHSLYLDDNNIVQTYDADYALEDECLRTPNGDWVHQDEVEDDLHNGETRQSYIEIDGKAIDKSDCKFCAYGNQWYEKDGMSEADDGKWVFDDDLEAYHDSIGEAVQEEVEMHNAIMQSAAEQPAQATPDYMF